MKRSLPGRALLLELILDLTVLLPAQGWASSPPRLTAGLLESWGFNVERFVARERMTLRWAGASLDSSFFDLKRAGRLAGVSELEQGLGLDVSPFSTGLWNTGFGRGDRALQGISGVDVSYNLTPQLTGVLTVNTDFGETEVDSQQVNLTRFSLFFPEKRTFFSQGSNQFRFGLGLGRSFIPFFSRRVGLFQGQKVPIDFGLKLLGRKGPWGIAALDVRTRKAAGARSANLLAGRVTYDVSPRLRLGTVFTNGDPDGVHDNSLLGIDAVWQTSTFRGDKNLALSAWAARSGGDVPEGETTGWGFLVDYPNDLWDVAASVKEFGEGLDPALGFLPRPGTRQYRISSAFQPRPSSGMFSWVRQFFFESSYSQVDNLEGETESWRIFTAPFNARTESGEHLEVNGSPQFEYLDEPFEIAPGVVIPPGEYHFTRYRAEAQSSRTRSWRIGTTVWFGEFFDGRLTQWEKFVNWTTLSGRLRLEVNLEDDFGRLPEGNFVKRLWQWKINYSFTPDLSLNSFTQFDSDSGRFGMNNRLRWTIHPGKDFFVVWNRNWEHPSGSRPYDLLPLSDQLLIKLVWTFRR
ncbi:MAG: DUF5916 domain-containing protein [Acidobacteriota bacterium]